MNFTIEKVENPIEIYMQHADELADVGANAFGQPVEQFGAQVGERFARASFAQIMHAGPRIAGFALYEKIDSCLWRYCIN